MLWENTRSSKFWFNSLITEAHYLIPRVIKSALLCSCLSQFCTCNYKLLKILKELQQLFRAETLCPETAAGLEIAHHCWVSHLCACLPGSSHHFVPNLAGAVLTFQSRDWVSKNTYLPCSARHHIILGMNAFLATIGYVWICLSLHHFMFKMRFVDAIVWGGTCNSVSEKLYTRCWRDEGSAKQLRPFLRNQAANSSAAKALAS